MNRGVGVGSGHGTKKKTYPYPDTLQLSLALAVAEEHAWAQKCPGPRLRRVVVNLGHEIMGEWVCEDDEKVCEELLWRTNEALERLGYTATYEVKGGHVMFHAYYGQKVLLAQLESTKRREH